MRDGIPGAQAQARPRLTSMNDQMVIGAALYAISFEAANTPTVCSRIQLKYNKLCYFHTQAL